MELVAGAGALINSLNENSVLTVACGVPSMIVHQQVHHSHRTLQ